MKTIEEQLQEFNYKYGGHNDYFKRCKKGHIVEPSWEYCAKCGESLNHPYY